VLEVKKSNDPGGVPLVADAGRPLGTDGSDKFAGGFVTDTVLVSRPQSADPVKYEAHLNSPRPVLIPDPNRLAPAGSRCGPVDWYPTVGQLLQLS
jgi:hypothetical protein